VLGQKLRPPRVNPRVNSARPPPAAGPCALPPRMPSPG
jgi:hypothetical protein